MLHNILSDIARFCRIISTVTGVDIEIVDINLNRVAGTGSYARAVGKSIRHAGNIYRHALKNGTTVYIDNPREHALCINCPNKDSCKESLTLCAPITLGKNILGIIGLICFTQQDKERVCSQKEVFIEFVQQMSDVISISVSNEQRSRKVSHMLDMLLQVTDRNTHGIVIVSRNGAISYANEVARNELSLTEQKDTVIDVRYTGNSVADMKEYDVQIKGQHHHCFGHLIPLESEDSDFAHVLLIDPVPRLTEMLSLFSPSADSSGSLNGIIGNSRVVTKLKKRVLQIAKTSSSVLITGESGTGKEIFARAIHTESERRDKPFIAINCGAIPDTLLESELFGYVSGAFTGANHSGRMGKFELAHNGILFLDEIGSMSLYLQVKLLRAIQEKNFTRLGSNRQINVDVRIIAATNENLPILIDQKMFRDDLYYRLNVIPLELPPLRQRKEDLPMLAEYFLERYCMRFGKPPARLSTTMLTMLHAYSWPGNIREFENCIEYMVNMHEGGMLSPALLPAKVHDAYVKSAASMSSSSAALATCSAQLPPRAVTPLIELENKAIRNALSVFGDTAEGKKQAAEALGIGIATLYRKLKQP